MKKNKVKGSEVFFTIIIIGFYLLLLLPIVFTKGNPVFPNSTGVYQDNVIFTIIYGLSSYILITIPFITKLPKILNISSLIIAGWSVASLYYELVNFKYPEITMNNPYDFQNPIRFAFFITTLILITIYREKVWNPLNKKRNDT